MSEALVETKIEERRSRTRGHLEELAALARAAATAPAEKHDAARRKFDERYAEILEEAEDRREAREARIRNGLGRRR